MLKMKNSSVYLAIAVLPILFSCSQGGNSGTDDNAVKTDTITNQQCYVAIDGKDTADLRLKTMSSGKVMGELLIKYAEKGKNEGEIAGTFKGDTLFVDYTFKIGDENKTTYKNPLAFLNKEGKLILGVGQIETTLGRSYFVKGKPISFDQGRFTFAPTECED